MVLEWILRSDCFLYLVSVYSQQFKGALILEDCMCQKFWFKAHLKRCHKEFFHLPSCTKQNYNLFNCVDSDAANQDAS